MSKDTHNLDGRFGKPTLESRYPVSVSVSAMFQQWYPGSTLRIESRERPARD